MLETFIGLVVGITLIFGIVSIVWGSANMWKQ